MVKTMDIIIKRVGEAFQKKSSSIIYKAHCISTNIQQNITSNFTRIQLLPIWDRADVTDKAYKSCGIYKVCEDNAAETCSRCENDNLLMTGETYFISI